MSELWQALLQGLASILIFFHDLTEPFVGPHSWGWAIILLTLVVRTFLLPLAIKQTTSMRAMQGLQPEVKRIQTKYKADRGMMRTDPERFRELRQKQQEELQKLYSERGINPAAGCLPLIAQMPIFFALFSVLQRGGYVPADAPFYLIERLSLPATGGAGIGAYLLIALMGVTTFVSQRQMMASNPQLRDQPQQKVLLYAMPVLLTVFGINFPAGVLLYWVTTNLWTMAQQQIMFRTIAAPAPAGAAASSPPPRQTKRTDEAAPEVISKDRDPSAPKGAPTPKQRDAVRNNRAASNGGSGSGGGTKRSKNAGKAGRAAGSNGRKGRGSSAASAKQRRS